MWRVIVRISYFRDTGSGLRNNHVVPPFTTLGLQNTATGTFESPAVDRIQAANILSQVLQAIAPRNRSWGWASCLVRTSCRKFCKPSPTPNSSTTLTSSRFETPLGVH